MSAGSIPEQARKSRSDLIVMETHGHTGVQHLVLGSVAEKVVRLASCPVLTVRGTEVSPRSRKKVQKRVTLI